MQLSLYGGFGEKGRTSIGVAHDGYRLIVDAGVKTSTPRDAADYYPAIPREHLAQAAAMVVTHGHEDHAAAIGW
jgi:mRNA degradation ribonuclease J1/J2